MASVGKQGKHVIRDHSISHESGFLRDVAIPWKYIWPNHAEMQTSKYGLLLKVGLSGGTHRRFYCRPQIKPQTRMQILEIPIGLLIIQYLKR